MKSILLQHMPDSDRTCKQTLLHSTANASQNDLLSEHVMILTFFKSFTSKYFQRKSLP